MLWSKSLGLSMAAVAMTAALAGPSFAAPKPPPGTGPAWVDLPKVLTEYRKTAAYAKHSQKLRDQARLFQTEMQTLAQLRYCTDQEREEALALKAKTKMNEKETARLDELMKRADKVDNEASVLSQKNPPSDADTKRLAEISKLRTDAAKNLAKAEADRRDKLRNMEIEATETVENELLALVEKLAKEQKLEVVYERRAVLVGGIDFTEQVIKKLPKAP